MRNLYVTLLIFLVLPNFSFGFSKKNKTVLNEGVKLYHQGNFEEANDFFNNLKNPIDASHRDSLTLFQYLGMTATQLGSDSLAIDYFSTLIIVDSLFQFPSNEAEGILKNFSAAHVLKQPPEILEIDPAPQNQNQTQAQPLPFTATELSGTNKIGFVYGAIPLGGGWLIKEKKITGWTLAALELAGFALSIYASEKQNDFQNDFDAIHDNAEKTSVKNWQWTQRISLSVALGTYLYSILSATGD